MDGITVGVLTISDRCYERKTVDESGPKLKSMVKSGVMGKAYVVRDAVLPDSQERIARVLRDWTDEGIDLILTTGGTGISERDVTPEATLEGLTRTIPGISYLLFQRSLEVTQFAALSRGIAGIRGKTLIINLPGSKKASQECLEAVSKVIPHAVDLIKGNKGEVEVVHASLEQKKSQVVANNPDKKRESPYPCISVSEAQEIIQNRLYSMRKEKVIRYDEAMGYVLQEDAIARDDLPPFACSTRDGYAVRSSDKLSVKSLIGVSNAGGSLPNIEVKEGQCVKISTGAALPLGADAVVQFEDTLVVDRSNITTSKFPAAGENVRQKGSDFRAGQILLPSKTYLSPAAVGVLAAAGLTFLRVFDKPEVAIMSTGDEVVNPGEILKPGQVRDSNRFTLLSLMKEENFKAVDLGIVGDNPDALRDALERGFRMADVVVTTGGVSVGERDYVKEVIEADFGGEMCFGRVLMKPGKPTALAIVMFQGKQKLWFGLPGNPASSLVAAHLFLLPALRKISGWEKIFPFPLYLQMSVDIPKEDRPQYVRCTLERNVFGRFEPFKARVMEDQKSSNIGNCVDANCLVEIPAKFSAPSPETSSASKTGARGDTTSTPNQSSEGPSQSGTHYGSSFGSYYYPNVFAFNAPKTSSGFGFESTNHPQTGNFDPSKSGSKVKENTPNFVKAFLIGKMYN